MNSIKLHDYIKLHQSWPGTICKVCGKEDRGPYYEIYKKVDGLLSVKDV